MQGDSQPSTDLPPVTIDGQQCQQTVGFVDAVHMVNTYHFPQNPEILVASIRGPLQVVESIRAGAQIATVPYKILEQLFHHPLTDIGIARFRDDYDKAIADYSEAIRLDPKDAEAFNSRGNVWWTRQALDKATDLAVAHGTMAAGGDTGWHSHPDVVFVTVTEATMTLYEADDPNCTPHAVQAGQAFVEGIGDVHIARNESTTDRLSWYATHIGVPSGVPTNTDQPVPGNCPF